MSAELGVIIFFEGIAAVMAINFRAARFVLFANRVQCLRDVGQPRRRAKSDGALPARELQPGDGLGRIFATRPSHQQLDDVWTRWFEVQAKFAVALCRLHRWAGRCGPVPNTIVLRRLMLRDQPLRVRS